ncbi:MAG: hypothetical protein A3I66_21610 [Burkholderiales bacterium RIFCSPLOWO2_02_FULL_57_36]|nr:MAG: hypothetical protein A3I66_21610 [Burkholderiales bacterium RIFCSPLOWO2_02_FULL_57_36]
MLLACALIAFTASAKAEIVQCVDEAGLITFTDVPCNADAISVRMPGSIKGSRAGAGDSPQAKRFAAAEQARAAASAGKAANNRRVALDVATSSAARASLLAIDQASTLQRQQASSQQEARRGTWEFWRS